MPRSVRTAPTLAPIAGMAAPIAARNGPPDLRLATLEQKILTRYENRMRADTLGAEIFSRVRLRDGWQLDGAFSAFRLAPDANGSQAEFHGHETNMQSPLVPRSAGVRLVRLF
jgi:hypothetical protein